MTRHSREIPIPIRRSVSAADRLSPLYPDEVIMTKPNLQYTSAAAAGAITIPFAAIVWLIMVPGAMSWMTFAALTSVALGGAFVALNTWRNSQATRSIAHVLNDEETKARRE